MDYDCAYNYDNRVFSVEYENDLRKSSCSLCLSYHIKLYDRIWVRDGKQFHFKRICSECKDQMEFFFYRI